MSKKLYFIIIIIYSSTIFVDHNFLRHFYRSILQRIEGEVYSVNAEEMIDLDSLEGYPDYYNRVRLPVEVNSKILDCFVYVLDR